MSPDPSPRSETAPIVATVADVPPVARRYRPSPLALCALAVAGVVVVAAWGYHLREGERESLAMLCRVFGPTTTLHRSMNAPARGPCNVLERMPIVAEIGPCSDTPKFGRTRA